MSNYEFRLHCHLLGHLRMQTFTILTTMVSDLEKHYIVSLVVEYGDQPDIYLWKITNSLGILRLRKPLETSTRLVGHGIWTRVLPNTSLVRYHGAHSPTFPSVYRRHNSYSNPSVALSLYLRHSSFSNPSVASLTSQFILQPFFRFSYVTSSSLNSPGEPPM